MKKRAFISVYDSTGLVEFARTLTEKFEYELISCNETYKLLKKENIDVIDIKEFSNSSELLSKDYSMLADDIIAGILAGTPDTKSLEELENLTVKSFDMVVANVRNFETLTADCYNLDEAVSKIDIAGLTILRAAAKNYKNVTVATDRTDYCLALNADEDTRVRLAAKALSITSHYDSAVSSKLMESVGENPIKSFTFEKIKDLKYGENPHQKGALFKINRMVDYEVVNGQELTFNNILNITEATNIVSEFYDVNCVAIIRYSKPCGVALGRSLYEAYNKAFDCDPISSFYGVVGFSKPVDIEVAKHLNSMSVEVVVAPDFDKDVVELFKDNEDIKLVKLNTSLKEYRRLTVEELIVTPFGALVQDRNNSELNKDLFKVVTKMKPTAEQIEDAIFAWKVVKHAKTTSVVIARDFKTTAIAQGLTNPMSAVDSALNYACDGSKDAVLACDSVLPAEDCVYSAIQGRISLIIQPGGLLKDAKLIEVCDKYGIAMITTGIRNYRQ